MKLQHQQQNENNKNGYNNINSTTANTTTEHYSIQWQGFTSNIISALEDLKTVQDFVDVTLSCDGQTFKGHKVILSAGSSYFRKILRDNPCTHPVIIINDIQVDILEAIMTYIYHGTVSLPSHKVQEFLKCAEAFKIKGIADNLAPRTPPARSSLAPASDLAPTSGLALPSQLESNSQHHNNQNIETERRLSTASTSTTTSITGDLSLLAATASAVVTQQQQLNNLAPKSASIFPPKVGAAAPPPILAPNSGFPPKKSNILAGNDSEQLGGVGAAVGGAAAGIQQQQQLLPSSKRRKTIPRKLGSFISSPFSSGEEDTISVGSNASCENKTPDLGAEKENKGNNIQRTESANIQFLSGPMKSNDNNKHSGLLTNNNITAPLHNDNTSNSNSFNNSSNSNSSNSNNSSNNRSNSNSFNNSNSNNSNSNSNRGEEGDEAINLSTTNSNKQEKDTQEKEEVDQVNKLLQHKLATPAPTNLSPANLPPTTSSSSSPSGGNNSPPQFQLLPAQLLNPAAFKDLDKGTTEQMTALLGVDQMAALLGPLWKSRQPRMCHYCNRMFSNKFNLKQHILNMHTVGREMQCEICNKKVKNKWYLRRHHVTHHGAPLKK